MKAVLRSVRSELTLKQATQLCSLWDEVWPSEHDESLEQRGEGLRADDAAEQRMVSGSEIFHLVEDGGQIVAVARSFVRRIQFEGFDEPRSCLALASVCSSPSARGRGLGQLVVEDSFSRLDEQLPWCLFQTGVPAFYEKLGAFRVENAFVDSFSKDPDASPWWDQYVMVRSHGANWPSGRVDLCGVAY